MKSGSIDVTWHGQSSDTAFITISADIVKRIQLLVHQDNIWQTSNYLSWLNICVLIMLYIAEIINQTLLYGFQHVLYSSLFCTYLLMDEHAKVACIAHKMFFLIIRRWDDNKEKPMRRRLSVTLSNAGIIIIVMVMVAVMTWWWWWWQQWWWWQWWRYWQWC